MFMYVYVKLNVPQIALQFYNFLAFETIDHGQYGQRSTMTTSGVSFTEHWQISVLPYGLPRTPPGDPGLMRLM